MWRKGNPPTLLVVMQTSTATMENNVEIKYLEIYLTKETKDPYIENYKQGRKKQQMKQLTKN